MRALGVAAGALVVTGVLVTATGAVRPAATAVPDGRIVPFAVTQTVVAAGDVQGFGGGTIYSPNAAAPVGAVAIVPGANEKQAQINWVAPMMAQAGFVVFTIDTLKANDQPAVRGQELMSALNFLTTASPAAAQVDPNKLAVMGHSLGGGGTFEAARTAPQLKAIIAMTPFDNAANMADVNVPALIFGADMDNIAPVDQHAIPFFQSMPAGVSKEFVELQNATHMTPTKQNQIIGDLSVAMMQKVMNNDANAAKTLCGAGTMAGVAAFMSNCPA